MDDHEAVPAWEDVSDSDADMLCDMLAVADCVPDARCVPLKLWEGLNDWLPDPDGEAVCDWLKVGA